MPGFECACFCSCCISNDQRVYINFSLFHLEESDTELGECGFGDCWVWGGVFFCCYWRWKKFLCIEDGLLKAELILQILNLYPDIVKMHNWRRRDPNHGCSISYPCYARHLTLEETCCLSAIQQHSLISSLGSCLLVEACWRQKALRTNLYLFLCYF